VPSVLSLAGRYGTRGLRVVGVHPVDEAPDAEEHDKIAETTLEEHMTYPSFIDVQEKWAKQSKVDAVPSFLVVDRKGNVVYRAHGSLKEGNQSLKDLTAAIEKALDQPS
jgi:hypothetical protein